ncbi:MAG: C39 family peptidase, partial [Chlamydiia bacterium]
DGMKTYSWILVAMAFCLYPMLGWHHEWITRKSLAPRGGLSFPQRVCLQVPHFHQGDARWGQDLLGSTPSSLAKEGCAVSCAAMVLASYGVNTQPGHLNQFLQKRPGGYAERGWIEWQFAAEVDPSVLPHLLPHYEDLPSYALIDLSLLAGNPVIIRVRSPTNTTHFMVIVGKEGDRYLVLDPGKDAHHALYPLDLYGSNIEALRFYRKPPSCCAPVQVASFSKRD